MKIDVINATFDEYNICNYKIALCSTGIEICNKVYSKFLHQMPAGYEY